MFRLKWAGKCTDLCETLAARVNLAKAAIFQELLLCALHLK
ncbi:hypothetical protein J2X05_000573 [Cellvibrio fibrivorans]|uniref:Uncharacterized protein n=1 Tax=Cellvibrio fibrivorans TaxID=126350 RepID=A0ABU1UTS4_9GAMM|nr:hypothetical protein [Cellvibrio fibrivorans]